ncbi:hypothetical protein GLOIN_2v1671036 [Rhizophagus irregularis DAOM 181602=DAOM 197198]|nr:hypothetical protein GLOIN_2v1671036 [Rhizophagus irregularis DAOM 181602=DAOM 197198]
MDRKEPGTISCIQDLLILTTPVLSPFEEFRRNNTVSLELSAEFLATVSIYINENRQIMDIIAYYVVYLVHLFRDPPNDFIRLAVTIHNVRFYPRGSNQAVMNAFTTDGLRQNNRRDENSLTVFYFANVTEMHTTA